MKEILERYLDKANDNSQQRLVAEFLLDTVRDGGSRELLVSACREISSAADVIADELACEHEFDSDAGLDNNGAEVTLSVTCRHCGANGSRVLDTRDMEWST